MLQWIGWIWSLKLKKLLLGILPVLTSAAVVILPALMKFRGQKFPVVILFLKKITFQKKKKICGSSFSLNPN